MIFDNFIKIVKLWVEVLTPPASIPRINPDLHKQFDEFCIDTNFSRAMFNSRFFNYRITYYKFIDWLLEKHPDCIVIDYNAFKRELNCYFNPRDETT